MYRLIHLFRTSIGSKLMVAITGTLLLGFLVFHAAGNMLILKGPDALNGYADWLQGLPILWGFRLGMLALFGVHILMTIRLARENRAARPIGYRKISRLGARLPGRLMLFSGLSLFGFLVFHILHLTVRSIGPEPATAMDAAGRVDVYARVLAGFSDPLIATVYLAAMGLLGLHLLHAVESLFQTLGFNHESYQGIIRVMAPVVSLLIAAGFALIPLLVLTGYIGGTNG